MTSRVDEEQAAVNSGVLDVLFTHGGEFFAEVGRMLIFDLEGRWKTRKLTLAVVQTNETETGYHKLHERI